MTCENCRELELAIKNLEEEAKGLEGELEDANHYLKNAEKALEEIIDIGEKVLKEIS